MTDAHIPEFNRAEHQPRAGGEILWSIRAWVIGICCSIPVEGRIIKVLQGITAQSASYSLFSFLTAVTSGAQRKISIACLCNKTTNHDEQTLLDILSLYQRNRTVEAMMLLRSMVSATAATEARQDAEEFSRLLLASGYWLSPPSVSATQEMVMVFRNEMERSGERILN